MATWCPPTSWACAWSRGLGEKLPDQSLRRLHRPRVGDQFRQLGHANLGQPHQHRRVAVEVRRGEVHARLVGDQRELDALVGHPRADDVALRRIVAKCLEIGCTQRTFPHHQLLAHSPIPRFHFRSVRERLDDAGHVRPGGHHPIVPTQTSCARNFLASDISSSTRERSARFSNTPSRLKYVPTIAPSAMSSWAATFWARTPVFTNTGTAPAADFTVRSASASVGEPAVAPDTQIASGNVAKTVVRVTDARSRSAR